MVYGTEKSGMISHTQRHHPKGACSTGATGEVAPALDISRGKILPPHLRGQEVPWPPPIIRENIWMARPIRRPGDIKKRVKSIMSINSTHTPIMELLTERYNSSMLLLIKSQVSCAHTRKDKKTDLNATKDNPLASWPKYRFFFWKPVLSCLRVRLCWLRVDPEHCDRWRTLAEGISKMFSKVKQLKVYNVTPEHNPHPRPVSQRGSWGPPPRAKVTKVCAPPCEKSSLTVVIWTLCIKTSCAPKLKLRGSPSWNFVVPPLVKNPGYGPAPPGTAMFMFLDSLFHLFSFIYISYWGKTLKKETQQSIATTI